MKAWRYSGTFLVLTGILHTAISFYMGAGSFAAMFRDGLVDSAGSDLQRSLSLWFLVCGILLIMFGQALQYYIKRTGIPAPASLGYSMLVFSVVGGVIVPLSGFWLFLPQALVIIVANRRKS